MLVSVWMAVVVSELGLLRSLLVAMGILEMLPLLFARWWPLCVGLLRLPDLASWCGCC